MVKSVAHELGTASMAIYNYFDSREDLLIAIADHVWLLFKAPKPKATWQGTLLAWLWAVKKHADLYPAITSLVGVDGRISSGWMAITAPISVLLHDQVGLRGKQLALATYLFVSNTMAMIRVVSQAAYRKTGESWRSEEIGLDDRQLEVFKKINLAALKEKEILDALFAQLIRGIEVFL